MIRVLNSFEDLGKSVHGLHQAESTSHQHPVKNWDLYYTSELLNNYPKTAQILDMGCAGNFVLNLCHQQGFKNCIGIDLTISAFDRIDQIKHLAGNEHKIPFKLKRMNIMNTTFGDNHFDLVTSLSVVEHEVNLETFFRENYRILKRGGTLFLTTDYWDPKIDTTGIRPFGLAWKIFSKKELNNLVNIAQQNGFSVFDNSVPSVSVPFVHWKGKNYTFASVTLTKNS